MKNFLLSSLLLFLLSCFKPNVFVPSGKNEILNDSNLKSPFSNGFDSYFFKTKSYIYGHYLSGLLMIKPFPQNIYRVIFTTEVGIKLFDFEISKDSFTVHYCLDKLNKKPVLKILEKDFRTLLLSGSEGINANISENNYEKKFWWKKDDEIFEYKQNSNTLEISTIKIYSPKEKPKMHASLENYNKGFPQTIKIIHDNIKLSIELNFIER